MITISEYLRNNLASIGLQSRKESNCGQRCAAIISGFPLGIVEAMMRTNKGTSFLELHEALHFLGVGAVYEYFETSNISELPEFAILSTSNIGYGSRSGHWTVYFSGVVYDSCLGIFPIQDLKENRLKLTGYMKITYVKDLYDLPL